MSTKRSRFSSTLVHAPVVMASIGTLDLSLEPVNYDLLIELLGDLQNGLVRKPDHFNNLHFLLLLVYDAFGSIRDRYPVWRWYHRIKKKLLTAKHFTIDSDQSRDDILAVIDHFIDVTPNIGSLVEERIQFDEQYLNSPIHGLFKSYSPIHTYLYLERSEKPILNEHPKLFRLFRSIFLKSYSYVPCDFIHFAITHKKTSLINTFIQEDHHGLDTSINLATERGWLPLHYAVYVGDKEMVGSIFFVLPFH